MINSSSTSNGGVERTIFCGFRPASQKHNWVYGWNGVACKWSRADSHAHLPEQRTWSTMLTVRYWSSLQFASSGFDWLFPDVWEQGVSSHWKKGLCQWLIDQSLMGHHSCWGLWPTCVPFVSPVEFHRHSQFVFRRIRFVRMSPLVRVIVVGAGNRGENYARYAAIHPERMKVRCSSRHC